MARVRYTGSMTIAGSDHDMLYAAFVARSEAYEGRAFVGVTSTGIFCRLSCPARKPRREACVFFESAGEAIEAGFRPCLRCHPLLPPGDADPSVRRLMAALAADPRKVWREADVAAMGIDPAQARRAFRRAYGLTFLELARLSRLRDGFVALGETGSVTQAQFEAGFSSPGAFRAAFARLLGAAPSAFAGGRAHREGLQADWIDTPLGAMIAVGDATHLHLLEFADCAALPRELARLRQTAKTGIGIGRLAPVEQVAAELDGFFSGRSADFAVPLAMHGTPFQRRVWQALRDIPAGETRSYLDLATAIGQPTATRAVARANGANQIALVIPCHRVIGADGTLTGYGGGLWRKRQLIALEGGFGHAVDAGAHRSSGCDRSTYRNDERPG